MASIRLFKKEVNDVLSEVIERCYECQLTADDKTHAKAESIIDQAIATFDDLIHKLSQKDVENYKQHIKGLRVELGKKSDKLLADVEKLNS
jgi:hypothetical protein